MYIDTCEVPHTPRMSIHGIHMQCLLVMFAYMTQPHFPTPAKATDQTYPYIVTTTCPKGLIIVGSRVIGYLRIRIARATHDTV